MRPVSDRTFQPIAWPQDPLHSQHGKKEEHPPIQTEPTEPVDAALEIPSSSAKTIPKIALSLYDNKGVMKTEEPETGQNLDLKA